MSICESITCWPRRGPAQPGPPPGRLRQQYPAERWRCQREPGACRLRCVSTSGERDGFAVRALPPLRLIALPEVSPGIVCRLPTDRVVSASSTRMRRLDVPAFPPLTLATLPEVPKGTVGTVWRLAGAAGTGAPLPPLTLTTLLPGRGIDSEARLTADKMVSHGTER